MMKVKVTITLDEAIWKRLRHQALDKAISASAIIESLISDYLKNG
jgi:hypothetical protein